MNTAAAKKYFTLAEANAMLPLVRAIVDDIVRLKTELDERQERLKDIRRLPGHRRDEDNPYDEEVQQVQEEIDREKERLDEFCDELRRLGVELKDPRIGLIDFLTQFDGREAYLCWKLGEGDIAYWHELEAGFPGRQSLLEGSVPGDKPGDTGDKK